MFLVKPLSKNNYMNDFSNICILIPSLNPDENLTKLVDELCQYKWKKITIIDDGSSNETKKIFDNISKVSKITVISHDNNQGKGAALKTGFKNIKLHAKDSCGIITVDADGQHLVKDIVKIALAANNNKNAVIFGVRGFGANTPIASLIGNKSSRYLLDAMIGIKIDDCQTGLRYLPASVIEDLLILPSSGYDYELECLIKINNLEYNIIQIKIETVYIDSNKGSHFKGLVDSSKILLILSRYSAVSISSFGIDIFLFTLALSYNGSILFATIFARILSGSFNFIFNKLLVFRSYDKNKLLKESTLYLCLLGIIALMSASILALWEGSALHTILLFKVLIDTSLFFLSFYAQKNIIFTDSKG